MRTYRNTLVLVAVLVALAAFVYVFEKGSEASGTGKSQEARVFDYDEQDLVGFELRGEDKTVALAKDEQGKWLLTAPERAEADEWSLNTVLWRVTRLTADAKLADTVDDPATYGLDKPQLVVTFTMKSGQRETLTLGNANPRGTGNYAVKEGSSALYLVNMAVGTDLKKLLTTPPKLMPTPTPASSPAEEQTPRPTATP